MSAPIRTVGGCALAAALALPLPGDPRPAGPPPAETPALVPFVGTIEAARASAAERNVPLLVHLVLEGEPQNDEYRDAILPHAGLRALCPRAVVIVSNNGEHAQTTVTEVVDGREVERPACSVYRMFRACPEHRETWDPLYFEFQETDGALRCPQTILLAPDGKVAWRHNNGNPPHADEVVTALKQAQAVAGPGLTLAELSEVRTLVARARKNDKDGDPAGAWRAYGAVLERISKGTHGAEASAGREAAMASMESALAAARALLVPGKAREGYARLLELEPRFVDTPLERAVKDARRKAERDKAIRDEIEAYKLELEAQRLWDEAMALLDAGEDKKVERVVRRLLRKKYEDTPAGRLARDRWPDWAAEEDGKGRASTR